MTGQEIFAKMTEALNSGKAVCLSNYTTRAIIKPKNKDCVKLGNDGNIYMQRGNRWDCWMVGSFRMGVQK